MLFSGNFLFLNIPPKFPQLKWASIIFYLLSDSVCQKNKVVIQIWVVTHAREKKSKASLPRIKLVLHAIYVRNWLPEKSIFWKENSKAENYMKANIEWQFFLHSLAFFFCMTLFINRDTLSRISTFSSTCKYTYAIKYVSLIRQVQPSAL